ncbi:hypothetical protein EPUS_04293 [Endocarpon pusillum Z07020]|uniref:Heterokaryon incompatibility domain-containing protein n=1 Tax=Endocarpon pusillum (strain Z07020 / HMAS-L-300199) TaxID=1263415 RepID=U1GVW0_ENDPU|nr:uncharacterized protein EPUS_04293 [Endocarpon pusillum Z07020]ERF76216.1 hypothetical protein EPUS_04293 [Endocarpon pusillum Z07020]
MASVISTLGKSRYRYEPLQFADEIRLLQLSGGPERKRKPVSCEIHHVRLSQNPPPYHALSYVWGSPDKTFAAHCEGGQTYIPVTKSLHTALLDMAVPGTGYNIKTGTMNDMQKPEESPLYWADGICINQDDVSERNQQVLLMGDTYRKGHRVITYIGEGNEEQWLGIIFGVQLQQYVHKRYPRTPDPRIKDLDRLEEAGLPNRSDPQWRYLRDVLSLPWSSRMWIVQETILNKNIMMQCGGLQFDWSVLGEMSIFASRGYIPFLAITDEDSPNIGLPASSPDPMDKMFMLRTQAGVANYQRFSCMRLLLSMCHTLKSTDPRDKVYALANVAKDWDELGIVPDYSCPVWKLYTDIAFRIMKRERSLTLLAAASFAQISSDLPSWVPDWSNRPKAGYAMDTSNENNLIHAASGASPAVIDYDESSRSLRAAGAVIDKVEFLSEVIGAAQFRRKPLWFEDTLKMVKDSSSTPIRLGGSRTEMEALWRTLIMNVAAMERLKPDVEAPSDYGSYFEAFIRLQAGLAAMEQGIDHRVTQTEYEKALAFDRALTKRVRSRSLCKTEKGFLGLVPEGTRSGDDICILLGGRMAYVLKKTGNITRFGGEAYIHGLMKGEALQSVQANIELIVINA